MVLEGFNGIWSLIVSKNHDRGGLDFTIAVYNGVVYRFHPDIIEYQIIHDHGKEIYDQWRTMVKSQVNLLTDLVRQIQSQLDSLIPSFTCSDRSANLCRKAGIPVHQGVAFLVPAKYA